MANLDKASAEPLYRQLEQLILTAIERGEYQAGDRIPSEQEFAAELDISRLTVRRAFDSLVAEGVLLRQPGKGTFIFKPKLHWPGPSFFSFSKTLSQSGFATSTKILDFGVVAAPSRVVADLGLSAKEEVVVVRRLRYVEDEPMAITSSYTFARYFQSISEHDIVNTPFNDFMEAASGLHIVGSRDHVEAASARKEEATALGIKEGDPLLLIRGVVYAEGNSPLVSTKDVFRGDRFRIGLSSGTQIELLNTFAREIYVPLNNRR